MVAESSIAHLRLRASDADGSCQAVRAGDTVLLRGQTGFTLDGRFIGKGDAGAQADQAMRNAKALLEEAGATMAHICKITTYITDRAYREPVYSALARHLGGIFPSSTGLIVNGLALPETLVAIDIEAVIPVGEAAGPPGTAHDRLRKFNFRRWLGQDFDCDGALAVRTAEEIYLGGLSGALLDGSRVEGVGGTPEDAAAQAETAFANLNVLLEEAGATLDDICKLTVAISDRAHRIAVYRTIGRHLSGIHPVSTGLIVNGFARPEMLFSLDVAVVPQRGTPHRRLRKYHSDNTRYGVERQKIGCDFCQVVDAGRRIFLRGQTGQDLDDGLTELGDAETQATQAMRNVETLLGEAGSGLGEIAKLVLYVTDRAHLEPARRGVLRHLAGMPCAMSEIIVKGLASPALAMEVDAFAIRA